jgi:hypothetical protein
MNKIRSESRGRAGAPDGHLIDSENTRMRVALPLLKETLDAGPPNGN